MVSGTIQLSADTRDERTTALGKVTQTASRGFAWDLEHGTEANQVDRVYSRVVTVALGESETVELGEDAWLAKVKGVLVGADEGNTTPLAVELECGETSARATLEAGDVVYLTRRRTGLDVSGGETLRLSATATEGAPAKCTVMLIGVGGLKGEGEARGRV